MYLMNTRTINTLESHCSQLGENNLMVNTLIPCWVDFEKLYEKDSHLLCWTQSKFIVAFHMYGTVQVRFWE